MEAAEINGLCAKAGESLFLVSGSMQTSLEVWLSGRALRFLLCHSYLPRSTAGVLRYMYIYTCIIYLYMFCIHRHISTISSLKVPEFVVFFFIYGAHVVYEWTTGGLPRAAPHPAAAQPTSHWQPSSPNARAHAQPLLETGGSRALLEWCDPQGLLQKTFQSNAGFFFFLDKIEE